MKVLNVIPGLSTNTGGPAFSAVDMAQALTRLGVEVSIFATDIMTPAQAQQPRYGLRVSDMPSGAETINIRTFPVESPKRLLYSPELRDALISEISGFDLVHIHSLFLYPQFVACRTARLAGVPYVVSPRGSLDPFLRQHHRVIKTLADALWQRSMLKHAHVIHVTAEEERAQLASLGYANNVQVCPNCIGPDWFDTQPSGATFREHFLAGFCGPLILFHGRLTRKKGLGVLLDAVSIVRNQGLPVQLAIVGPDEEGLGKSLRAKAEELGLRECITFVGMLNGEALRSALAAADVWAMPSHGENFGNAVVEALASGLPVVVSPQVNIAEAIAQENAAVIAERTPDAFAEALVSLLLNSRERKLLAVRAKTFAKNYDSDTTATRMYKMYDEALLKNEDVRMPPCP